MQAAGEGLARLQRRDTRRAAGRLYAFIAETFSAVQAVQVAGAEAPVLRRFEKLGEVRRTNYLQVTRIFYQDASYVKLREVTLTWDIPQKWVAKTWAGASGAKLSLSGRNLYWWTKFRGGDPEAQNFGAGGVPDAIQRNRELAAYPASRSYWLNFSLDF